MSSTNESSNHHTHSSLVPTTLLYSLRNRLADHTTHTCTSHPSQANTTPLLSFVDITPIGLSSPLCSHNKSHNSQSPSQRSHLDSHRPVHPHPSRLNLTFISRSCYASPLSPPKHHEAHNSSVAKLPPYLDSPEPKHTPRDTMAIYRHLCTPASYPRQGYMYRRKIFRPIK